MEGLLKNCIVLSLGLHVLEFYMFLHVLAISICLHGSFCGFCFPFDDWRDFGSIFAIMQGESFRDQIYFSQMTFSIFDTDSVQELCAGENEYIAGLARDQLVDLDRLLANVQLMVP